MSDKIQKKLDQETLSPVFAVFLRFLLVFYGLLDEHKAFGDSKPKIDGIPAMDQAVGTDLSTAIRQATVNGEAARATLGERLFDDMLRQRREHIRQERMRDSALNVPGGCSNVPEDENHGEDLGEWRVGNVSDCERVPMPTVAAYNPRRPNDLRRFDEMAHEPNMPEVHIDMGALGTAAIPVPEGAKSLEVDPRTFTIMWTMGDLSVSPSLDLRDYMTSLPRRQIGGFLSRFSLVSGYCTPSRRPVTGRDTNGRHRSFQDIGHFSFSDGSPVDYGIDHNGRAVMLEQGAGPTPESRHVGPTVVGRRMDGRLVLMSRNGTPYTEGERGDGPSLESADGPRSS